MTMPETEMSSGTVAVTLVVFGFLAVATPSVAIAVHRLRGNYGDGEGPIATLLLVALTAAVMIPSVWWGMYPWKAEYHEWRPVSGTVERVDTRMLSNENGGTYQKVVIKFVGNEQQYGVDDTRAAGLKEGDKAVITCKRAYQWAGTHGYDCAFVDMEPAK